MQRVPLEFRGTAVTDETACGDTSGDPRRYPLGSSLVVGVGVGGVFPFSLYFQTSFFCRNGACSADALLCAKSRGKSGEVQEGWKDRRVEGKAAPEWERGRPGRRGSHSPSPTPVPPGRARRGGAGAGAGAETASGESDSASEPKGICPARTLVSQAPCSLRKPLPLSHQEWAAWLVRGALLGASCSLFLLPFLGVDT